MREGGIIRGQPTVKRLALVFTGHEYGEGGETILNELAKRRAKASFFFTGDFCANTNFAALIRRIAREGHYLGPHSDKHLLYCSWSGPKTSLVSRAEFRADLEANLEKIEKFGLKRSDIRFLLPPYEHYNLEIATWTRELGLTLINYTPGTRSHADYTGEADKNFVSSQAIFDSIMKKECEDPHGLNGFILLLHVDSGPERKDKFPYRFGELLDALAAKNYQFVRVDELLAPLNFLSTALSDEIYIRGSQVGYGARAAKIAMAFSKSPLPQTFSVVNAVTDTTIFHGRVRSISGVKWGQFDHHAELDFTKLRKSGRYVLRVSNARSQPFVISSDAFTSLPDQLLEFMCQQRCGYNPWLGTNCHQLDGRTVYGPLTNGTPLDARGGWHDAGDLLKYLLTSGNATAQMLLAYEVGRNASPRVPPSPFADRVNALGQPGGNDMPDILDEARWGLDWLLKLHPSADQLYHQVADDRDHYGWRLPPNEEADYGWGNGGARPVYFADGKPQGLQQYQSASTGVANLAGRYAAAMALAYEIWKDEPQQMDFARRCLQAGREVYELGRAKEGVQQGNSYKSPYRYEETTWADDMEWGAAELFRATHEARYLDDAKRYAQLAADESWMGKEQTGHYQFYPFMNLGHYRLHGLVDRDFNKLLAGYYRRGIERCMNAGEKSPYRLGAPLIWCSNNLLTALVTQCLLYERMTGDTRYREFAAKQRDWLLGCNPWGVTMFTGIGDVFPHQPHLMTTQLLKRPVRGGLVDGPVYARIFNSLKGVTIVEPDPLAAFQGAAVYHDDVGDYSTNEPTMDGTASAILMFALAMQQ